MRLVSEMFHATQSVGVAFSKSSVMGSGGASRRQDIRTDRRLSGCVIVHKLLQEDQEVEDERRRDWRSGFVRGEESQTSQS
jgi:hypothetical protein